MPMATSKKKKVMLTRFCLAKEDLCRKRKLSPDVKYFIRRKKFQVSIISEGRKIENRYKRLKILASANRQ